MTEDYLIHYGILGMKWGIRRYQNPDGTLTDAGKKHYSRKYENKINRTEERRLKAEVISGKETAKKTAIVGVSATAVSTGLTALMGVNPVIMGMLGLGVTAITEAEIGAMALGNKFIDSVRKDKIDSLINESEKLGMKVNSYPLEYKLNYNGATVGKATGTKYRVNTSGGLEAAKIDEKITKKKVNAK